MLFQFKTGMNVNRIVIFMIERQCVEELQMLRRNGVLNLPASVIEILLAGYVKSSAYILLKRVFAAGLSTAALALGAMLLAACAAVTVFNLCIPSLVLSLLERRRPPEATPA